MRTEQKISINPAPEAPVKIDRRTRRANIVMDAGSWVVLAGAGIALGGKPALGGGVAAFGAAVTGGGTYLSERLAR